MKKKTILVSGQCRHGVAICNWCDKCKGPALDMKYTPAVERLCKQRLDYFKRTRKASIGNYANPTIQEEEDYASTCANGALYVANLSR